MGLFSIILNRGSIIEIASCLISSVIVVFLVMPVHEYAHGFAAERLGDPTPRWQGRMTLNPMRHIDYVGAIMIFLIGFGWAKPVQCDSRYFKKPKRDMAITALAGPLANLICAFVSALLCNTMLFTLAKCGVIGNFNGNYFMIGQSYVNTLISIIVQIFSFITIINISLAVFNLIPIPPLDGSKILFAILPDRIYWQIMRYERILYFALIFLIFAGSGFSMALSKVVYSLAGVIDNLVSLPFELFL